MGNTGAMSRLTRRFVRPDKRGRVELFGPDRREDATYLVTDTSDGAVVLIPAGDWTDADIDLVLRPDVQDLLKPGGRPVFESPIGRTDESDTSDLACLAMRQAGLWGEPAFEVDVDNPLFDKAVEAAEAAGPDEQRAFDAAQAALDGEELADRSTAPPIGTGLTEALASVSMGVTPFTATFLKKVSQAWHTAPGDAEEVTFEVAISPDGHLAPERDSEASHIVVVFSMKMTRPDGPLKEYRPLPRLLFRHEIADAERQPQPTNR